MNGAHKSRSHRNHTFTFEQENTRAIVTKPARLLVAEVNEDNPTDMRVPKRGHSAAGKQQYTALKCVPVVLMKHKSMFLYSVSSRATK